jgi:hypothetical protein
MISLSTEYSMHDNDAVPAAPCKVIVFYDDVCSRERVLKLCDYLVPQFWEDFEFEISWWKVNLFTNPAFHKAIARELAEADIVIFALTQRFEMPSEVKASLESLMECRSNKHGLLVMALSQIFSLNDQQLKTHHYLAGLARKHQMDYLSEGEFKRNAGQRGVASKEINPTDMILPIEGQHWGINE